ncbi:MAG TPA: ECF transporter S component [Chloroflexia bacterium]|nr:ECF transporter S component [Chloroflexia bacterium]
MQSTPKIEIPIPAHRASNALSTVILALATMLGVWAFLYPFFIPPEASAETGSHAADAPLIFLLVVGLCLTAVVADMETRHMDSKTVALLGVMVATNALLRPLQGPGGFSVFLGLPILCGYVFGGLFGFLLGALSVLVSALLMPGGVGPWLPFQMLAIGWVGLLSAILPGKIMSTMWHGKVEKWLLAAWGAVAGLLIGAVMNLWFWPYIALTGGTPDEQVWHPGAGLIDAVQRYAVFYFATSFAWDVWKSVGTALVLLVLGPSVLRLLRRYKQRFFFTYSPRR